MKNLILFLFTFVLLPSSNSNIDQNIELQKMWETNPVFQAPESVVYDHNRDVLYASNFNDKGGFRQAGDTIKNEYISKIDLNGNIIKLKWIEGLIGPTGLCIFNDMLYAVERGFMTIIDIQNENIIKRVPLLDYGFPNDITADLKGNFYITDSSNKTIYKANHEKAEKWMKSDEISGMNGVLLDKETLLVGVGNNDLKSINIQTKKVNTIVNLGEGIIDGIKKYDDNYLVSHYKGNIYRVTKKGEITELLNTRDREINCADFEYIEEKKMLIIPALMNNKLFAYRIVNYESN